MPRCTKARSRTLKYEGQVYLAFSRLTRAVRTSRYVGGDVGTTSATRAEPFSVLYAVVHHVGVFDELEVEMTMWTAESSESPNRMDALS